MAKLGALVVVTFVVMLAASGPSSAGCVCKDPRTTWCAKSCYVCYSNHAVPTGSCSYWLDKRKHRKTKDAQPS